MQFYLGASVAPHAVLSWGDTRARAWLQPLGGQPAAVCSSTLLPLKMVRARRRKRVDTTVARLVLNRLDLISIDDGVLHFAGAIEPHVKSLNAIHPATCSPLDNAVTLVTHDANMADVASGMGCDVFDPLAAQA